MLTSSSRSFDFILATSDLVTTLLVRPVAAVVVQVTDLTPVDAVSVVTLEVAEQVRARPRSVGTQGHVVFIRAISTIVLSVTNVESGDALEVVTLEFLNLVAGEVLAELLAFIGLIAAIVFAVAEVVVVDADVILTLVLVLCAITSSWISWRTILFVGQIRTISFSVTFEFGLDAMARVALESVSLTRVLLAVLEI